jgi:Tfp pilus assembly protein PilN
MKLDLNKIKKRFGTRSFVAITIESGRIAVSLVKANEEIAQPGFFIALGDEDVLKEPEKAGQQLAAALGAAGIRERQCVVCVPPGWVLTASADLPEVAVEDLRGYLELRAEQEFAMPASDLRLGYCAYSLPNGQQRATLAALSAKKLDAIEKMLQIANRHASSVSLALDRCMSRSEPMLHFLTNGNHTDVVVTSGGGVAGLRSLGGPVMTGDVTFDPSAFCREVRITLGRLPEAVRQQVRQAAFGGPSARTLYAETHSSLLRMGIESPGLDQPSTEANTEVVSAAVDTARRKLEEQAIPFEFVVPETKAWQAALRRFDTTGRRRLLIGAGALVVFPLLLLIIRGQMEGRLQAQWDDMATDAADLDGIQQKIHQFRPWFNPAPESLQLMESLVSAFPDMGDVWAKSIQIAEGHKVTCTGFARTQTALMTLLGHLRARPDITDLQVQQIRGENPIQFSITYQWEPQHDR